MNTSLINRIVSRETYFDELVDGITTKVDPKGPEKQVVLIKGIPTTVFKRANGLFVTEREYLETLYLLEGGKVSVLGS